MVKKPYLTDAIIGNSKMLATLNMDGDLIRLWWPQITYPQHIKSSYGGICIEGTDHITWMNDSQFQREQKYIEDTNMLWTKASSPELNINIELTDFAVANGDTLIRNYRIGNNALTDKSFTFLYYTAFQTHDSKLYGSAFFNFDEDAVVHYKHKYCFAIGSSAAVKEFTTEDALADAEDGRLDGVECSMSDCSCLSFELGTIRPGEYKDVTIYISCGDGHQAALKELQRVKRSGFADLYKATEGYWRRYIKKSRQIEIRDKRIQDIYKRSLLIFKLVSDENHGAIAAAPEVDEAFDRCGGYGFCWGRDAAYIVKAIDKAGCTDLSTRFFHWAKTVQEQNGSWEQRYYIDGYLAPAWGSQVDETGAILWGIYQHYEIIGDMKFLEEMWKTIKRGAQYLMNFIDDSTGLPKPSMDLWEERKGEHIYSAACVYGGLIAASKAAELMDEHSLLHEYQAAAERLKKSILKNGWNQDKGAFIRSIKREIDFKTAELWDSEGKKIVKEKVEKGYTKYYLYEDDIIDISLLGISEPFELLDALDEKMICTANAIENKLWVENVGGIKRYEDDPYIGGNPWILTTLWLALFKIRQGEHDRAVELLQWAAEHSTKLGLLPEQVDKSTGEPAWVIPLTWSHAMFVLTVLELIEKGQSI